jgi:hypothetical protein
MYGPECWAKVMARNASYQESFDLEDSDGVVGRSSQAERGS